MNTQTFYVDGFVSNDGDVEAKIEKYNFRALNHVAFEIKALSAVGVRNFFETKFKVVKNLSIREEPTLGVRYLTCPVRR